MHIEKEIADLKWFYDLAKTGIKGDVYHVPILKVWPLIEKLLYNIDDLV